MGLKYVIGLGNPGESYQNTRHNFGRALVSYIVAQKQYHWNHTSLFDWTSSSPSYIQLKTYMNQSGQAVLGVLKKFNAQAQDCLICFDDFDLPLGTLRIRKKGSAGSHNGLKSIIEHLGTLEIPRLRLGIGPILMHQDPADFVLRRFSKQEYPRVHETLIKASDALETIYTSGLEKAMNAFNATGPSS
jgi:PTH1 family peptidyl-tRNA hydrolase